MDDRAFASATELTNEIRDRRIGCVELLDFYLARADRHNPALNAIVVWQVDQARERAHAADAALARGERWGPLHGIPMTVKESFNVAGLPTAEQESTLTAAFGVMAQVRPDFLLGGEARFFRQYGGIGLNELAGEAFFVGPTAYFQLSDRARLTATWSFQAWGRPAGTSATLDLVNFERQQARVVFGLNF